MSTYELADQMKEMMDRWVLLYKQLEACPLDSVQWHKLRRAMCKIGKSCTEVKKKYDYSVNHVDNVAYGGC